MRCPNERIKLFAFIKKQEISNNGLYNMFGKFKTV